MPSMLRIKVMTFQVLDQTLGNHAPFLLSLVDGVNEELHIVISPAVIGEMGTSMLEPADVKTQTADILKSMLSKTKPITPGEKYYEIIFTDYIVYQTRNESFCSFDREEIRKGNHLILFEKSKLLDSLKRITDARQFKDGSYYPGKWIHYGIYTQNHVIDVIAHKEPVIREYKERH